MLGSQARSGGTVYVNTVGTFGVASTSYYWSRTGVSHTISRVTQRSHDTDWWQTISTSTREEVVIVKHSCLSSSCAHFQGSRSPGRRQPEETHAVPPEKLPSHVAFILRHLSNQVERERHFSCATRMLPTETSPRVDARARQGRESEDGYQFLTREELPIPGSHPGSVWRSHQKSCLGCTRREANPL